jgi:hypothetical protein
MAYAFVQKGMGYAAGTNIASCVTGTGTGSGQAALSNQTAGHCLVAMVGATSAKATAGTITLTDTLGNTWVPDTTGVNFQSGGGGGFVVPFYCLNCLGGANQVTATDSAPTGNTILEITVVELSGIATLSAYAGSKTSFTGVAVTTANAISTGNFTPTGQPGALVGFSFGVSYTTTYPITEGTSPNAFTNRGFDTGPSGSPQTSSTPLGVLTEDARVTSTSATSATATSTIASNQGYFMYGILLLEGAGSSNTATVAWIL